MSNVRVNILTRLTKNFVESVEKINFTWSNQPEIASISVCNYLADGPLVQNEWINERSGVSKTDCTGERTGGFPSSPRADVCVHRRKQKRYAITCSPLSGREAHRSTNNFVSLFEKTFCDSQVDTYKQPIATLAHARSGRVHA